MAPTLGSVSESVAPEIIEPGKSIDTMKRQQSSKRMVGFIRIVVENGESSYGEVSDLVSVEVLASVV
ncbi:MAG: hypothetical protein SynsKO_38310 [Synoicihabitans sp.]